MGHSIATNIFMLGYAFQRGLMPLSLEAILRAIELNGAAVEDNRRAFHWGRRAAHDPAGVEALLAGAARRNRRLVHQPRRMIARRRATSRTIRTRPTPGATWPWSRVRAAEAKARRGDTALTEAVARNYHKLLAYKDEYEVARLFAGPSSPRWPPPSRATTGWNFHITLPWSRGATPGAEPPKKIRFGPWLLPAMKLLARFKFLRGTALNPFGRSPNGCRNAS
jgi:indolepyruvate ferredoxin oxidoreductase